MKLSLMLLFIIPLTANGQPKINARDSIEIKKQIEGFYSWYIDMIKTNKLDNFNPSFVKQDDGRTTLDFKKYKDGLRSYKFTEEFIERKINDYKDCVDHLKDIPFDKFSQYTDLDDFESIKCDFGNRYEWTGGQEAKDKADLSSLKIVDKKTIVGKVDFTSYSQPEGDAVVTFRKVGKHWKIDNLELE